jgi:hypothetical protein
MVGDASVFSFVDGAGSCFVAGAESGDAGFDVCCVGFGASPELGVDDVVGRVGSSSQVQGQGRSPKLVLQAQTALWDASGERLVRWPAFTVLGLGSRFGRP